MILFNGYVVPEAQHHVRNLLTDVARKKPALRIRERVFMDDFPGYVAYISTLDERRSRVAGVVIFDRTAGGTRPSFVTAPTGDIAYAPDGRYLMLALYDGEIHELASEQNYRRLRFRKHVINVPADDELVRRDREYRSDQEMALPGLLRQLRQLDQECAGLAGELGTADTARAEPAVREVRLREAGTRLHYKKLEYARHEVELQKRLSLAFSCLLFVFFGAPLGLLLRRGGLGTGFVVGLVFFGVYYVLLLAGQALADSGKLSPFIGMWLPNLILVLPVVELSTRAMFERSPLLLLGERLRVR
jgi:lipopolysaccharide export system permease protein